MKYLPNNLQKLDLLIPDNNLGSNPENMEIIVEIIKYLP